MEKILLHRTISRAVSAPWKLAPEVRDSLGLAHLVGTRKHLANRAAAVRNAREDVAATGRTSSMARPTPASDRLDWIARRVSEAIELGVGDPALELTLTEWLAAPSGY